MPEKSVRHAILNSRMDAAFILRAPHAGKFNRQIRLNKRPASVLAGDAIFVNVGSLARIGAALGWFDCCCHWPF
jgi:hypothetical protein